MAKSSVPFFKSCLSLAAVFVLARAVPAIAGTLDDLPKRPSFDYEQCANACQSDADQALGQCDGYRKAEDGAEPPNCRRRTIENYDLCLKSCPADTGLRW